MYKEKIIWDDILVGYRIYDDGGCFGLKRFKGYECIEGNIAYYNMFMKD